MGGQIQEEIYFISNFLCHVVVYPCPYISEPLPVDSVFIHDYKPAPETSVIFELKSAENNVFTRVNISYSEGQEQRSMLYKGGFH